MTEYDIGLLSKLNPEFEPDLIQQIIDCDNLGADGITKTCDVDAFYLSKELGGHSRMLYVIKLLVASDTHHFFNIYHNYVIPPDAKRDDFALNQANYPMYPRFTVGFVLDNGFIYHDFREKPD